MDKVIATALLIIASVVGVGLIVNAALPAISRSSSAMITGASNVDDRIKTQISVVHHDYDTGADEVYIWVKNVGKTNITALQNCDVFFGPEGGFDVYEYDADPGWDYEGDNEWLPESTKKFTVYYDGDIPSGTFHYKIITPNGISDEDYLSIS